MSPVDEKKTLHVYLIESHPLAADYVLGLFDEHPLIRAFNFRDVSRSAQATQATPIYLLDNRDLPLPLSEYLRRLRSERRDAKFVVMDQEEDKESVMRMLWLGVNGFVPYRDVPHSLVSALQAVASGKIWVSREVLAEYVHRTATVSRNELNGMDALTFRENQIIELVKRRLSNKEIGDALHIRESTVKFHLSNIFSKLQVSGRHALFEKKVQGTERLRIIPFPA